ncbi:MAG: alpha/beta fold hydrolase [Bryobacteraceae bacterium]
MVGRTVPRRWIVATLAGVIGLALGAIYLAYRREMESINGKLFAGSQVCHIRNGSVEFTTWGTGPAVLVVHGAAGGYDQGVLIAKAFGGEDFRWIAPSRFGYLRTPLPGDASTIAQADAFAELLDSLGIERVAIVAMSGGVPPSLQFALRYPLRTSALVLLSSAPYTPLTAAQQHLPIPIWLYYAMFSSDLPYWALAKVARPSLETVFDVKPNARAALTATESEFLARMVDMFEPVTKRKDGMQNEGAAISPGTRYPLEQIAKPTLVIHSRDDGINPFAFGEYTARHIPNAKLVSLETGGHLLLGHHAEVGALVNSFLRDHASR